MSIETKVQAIKEDLDFFEDELQKYEFIIDLGKKLEPFDETLQTEENMVQGCTSQVWLVCEEKEGKLYFRGTSDAIIVKGLVYILLNVFSGETIKELQQVNMDVVQALNLSEVITPNRQSGITGMMKKIKTYANDYKETL